MLVYAGWNGNFGSQAIPYDEAFVLSLPDSTGPRRAPAIRSRRGLTCNAVDGSQILAIGGVGTTQDDPDNPHTAGFNTPDPRPHGMAIFDMTSLNRKTSHTMQNPRHTPPLRKSGVATTPSKSVLQPDYHDALTDRPQADINQLPASPLQSSNPSSPLRPSDLTTLTTPPPAIDIAMWLLSQAA
jgi:hypothetical protein